MKKEVKEAKKAGETKRVGETKKAVFIFSIAIVLLILSFIFDEQIFLAIQNLRSPLSDAFFSWMLFIEKEFIFYPLIIFIPIALLVWKKRKRNLKPFILSIIILGLVVLLLKLLTSRQRPTIPTNLDFGIFNDSFSSAFPSGHAAIIFAALPFLEYKVFKGITVVWIIIAFLFSFVRVWFGLHYLSDVITGSIIGYATSFIIKNIKNTKKGKKR